MDKNPYSPDEQRVADFLDKRAGIGGGNDPIGFILASYAYVVAERNLTGKPEYKHPDDRSGKDSDEVLSAPRVEPVAWRRTFSEIKKIALTMKSDSMRFDEAIKRPERP